MVKIAEENAFEAGLGDLINFKQMQVRDFTTAKEYGVIVGNPPYGERLGEKAAVQRMYAEMGSALAPLDTWSIYILTSDEEFETHFGKKRLRNASSSMVLFAQTIISTGAKDRQEIISI